MATYDPELIKTFDNIAFTRDGSVWATWLLRGVRVDTYSQDSIRSAVRRHSELMGALSELDVGDLIIAGFETDVDAEMRIHRYLSGVDGYDPTVHTDLAQSVSAYSSAIYDGSVVERKRVFVLSVRMNTYLTIGDRVQASMLGKDVFSGGTTQSAREFAAKVEQVIPDAFGASPAYGDMLHWVWDRMRLRGIYNPKLPSVSPIAAPEGGFNEVVIDEVADPEHTIEGFARRFARGDEGTHAKKSLLDYFRTLTKSQVIAVKNPEDASGELVEATSYQSVMAVTGYPTMETNALDSLAIYGDIYHGDTQPQATCDWVQRIWFAPELADTAKLRRELLVLSQEAASNSESELEMEDYDNRARELMEYNEARSQERPPIPIRVTTIFAFGSHDYGELVRYMQVVKSSLNSEGYRVSWPTGGQTELWRSMLPGSPRTSMVEELAGTTLVSNWSNYVMMRRSSLGDGEGLPLGVMIDNTLATEVNINLLTATQAGNASVAITGAQGRGKSYAIKKLVSHLVDSKGVVIILDGQGEYAVYARSKERHQIIDLVRPSVSIDPLKLFGVTDHATEMLATLILPMLGVTPISAEGAMLKERLNAEWLITRGISTTRGFLESIVNPHYGAIAFEMRDVVSAARSMLSDPAMAALIDPYIEGRVQPLPPARLEQNLVVFVTHGLDLPDAETPLADMTLRQRYSLMVNSAVAYLTESRFFNDPALQKVPGAFVIDEASFYADLPVLKRLVQRPDRTGRKFGKFVIVGSQTGQELSAPEYKLIRRRLVFGQDTYANASEALSWAGFDPTPELVSELVSDTSPTDPDRGNMPEKGREGEAFYFDGTSRGKIKVYPEFRDDLSRLADTRTDRMIRYEED